MRERRDANPLPRADQLRDQMRTAVGLAGARRPLDRHVAVVQMRRPAAHLVEVPGEPPIGGALAGHEPGQLPPQQRQRHRVGRSGRVRADQPGGEVVERFRFWLGRHPVVEHDRFRQHAQFLAALIPCQVDDAAAKRVHAGVAGLPVGRLEHEATS